MAITLYHNPRCSKSRQALRLLIERDISPTIIDYLRTPPTIEELNKLLTMLNINARDFIRKSEAEYLKLGLDNPSLSDKELMKVMVATPVLIQRPILVVDHRAVIGRPPESILSILP